MNEVLVMLAHFIKPQWLLTIISVSSTMVAACGTEQNFSNTGFPTTPSAQPTYEGNATAITATPAPQELPAALPSPPPKPTAAPEPLANPTDLAALCATLPRKSRVVPVSFAESQGKCPWSVGNNLPAKDGIVRARREESHSLETNEKEAICSIKVNSTQQQIKFDDELILTFNDVVLLSSYDYSKRYPQEDGMPVYRWDGLKNAFNPGPATPFTPFCIGSPNDPKPACTVPKTETTGLFKLDVPADISAKLSTKALAEKRATIGLVVTGDDDSADCNHSEIKLDIELEYVELP